MQSNAYLHPDMPINEFNAKIHAIFSYEHNIIEFKYCL